MSDGRAPDPQGRRWLLLVLRVALAALGALALFIGLWNAWDLNATTAPLILGAVAVALALALDPNLSEISGRYGSAEFKVLRGRVLNAAELIRTAAGAVVDVQKRTDLEEIAGEVERQSLPLPRERGLRSLARRLQRLFWSETPGAVEAPIASDQVEDEEARAAYFDQFRSGYDWAKGVTDWGLPTRPISFRAERQADEPITRASRRVHHGGEIGGLRFTSAILRDARRRRHTRVHAHRLAHSTLSRSVRLDLRRAGGVASHRCEGVF